MRTKTIALVALALALVPAAAATGGLSVAVLPNDDGTATVSVTENQTAVENATVIVETVDENASYDGAGEYTTDEDGTVGLPAPNETVEIDVTAELGNQTGTTSVVLGTESDDGGEADENETAENDTADGFGQELQQFKLSINTSDPGMGILVAEYATSNNPGNAPEHAGPKNAEEFLNQTGERGPPDHAGGPNDDGERGPPEHAGNGGKANGNGSGNGNGNGSNGGNGPGNGNGNAAVKAETEASS